MEIDNDIVISIHTSAREVTGLIYQQFADHVISIHTSAREVTGHAEIKCTVHEISIHTSAREVTAIFHKNICLFL